jgi:hypothetical protein
MINNLFTNKRQTIILLVLAIAVLYGLYDLTVASNGRHTAPTANMRPGGLQSFVAQTTMDIGKNAPSAYDIYVTNRAGRRWVRNPFSGPASLVSRGSKDNVDQQSLFIFNGYIETGSRAVAIINNSAYLVGDALDAEGYFVKKISPASVRIENRKEKTEFEVPVSE